MTTTTDDPAPTGPIAYLEQQQRRERRRLERARRRAAWAERWQRVERWVAARYGYAERPALTLLLFGLFVAMQAYATWNLIWLARWAQHTGILAVLPAGVIDGCAFALAIILADRALHWLMRGVAGVLAAGCFLTSLAGTYLNSAVTLRPQDWTPDDRYVIHQAFAIAPTLLLAVIIVMRLFMASHDRAVRAQRAAELVAADQAEREQERERREERERQERLEAERERAAQRAADLERERIAAAERAAEREAEERREAREAEERRLEREARDRRREQQQDTPRKPATPPAAERPAEPQPKRGRRWALAEILRAGDGTCPTSGAIDEEVGASRTAGVGRKILAKLAADGAVSEADRDGARTADVRRCVELFTAENPEEAAALTGDAPRVLTVVAPSASTG